MVTRPKEFRAVRDCSVAGSHFAAGELVPPGVALEAMRRHGDRFVTSARPPKTTEATNSEESA